MYQKVEPRSEKKIPKDDRWDGYGSLENWWNTVIEHNGQAPKAKSSKEPDVKVKSKKEQKGETLKQPDDDEEPRKRKGDAERKTGPRKAQKQEPKEKSEKPKESKKRKEEKEKEEARQKQRNRKSRKAEKQGK